MKFNIPTKIISITSIFYFILIGLIILFGRAFTGIYIGNFRLGEMLIGFCLILFIYIFINLKYFQMDKKIFYNLIVLFLFFLYSFFKSSSSFLDPYTYKSSSYIWTITFFYFGYIIFQSKYTERFIKFLFFLLPFCYIFTIMFFPNPFYNFFITFSDKFDYLKASDILLTYILLNFLSKRYLYQQDFSFYYFVISTMFLAPLFSFMSRGAFLSFLIYVLIEIILKFKYVKKNLMKSLITLLVGLFSLGFSTIIIMTEIDFEFLNFGKKLEVKQENQYIEVQRAEIVNEKIKIVFKERDFFGITLSIIYSDGRFYSSEPTANWRLQLWQDIIDDLRLKEKISSGYGYSDIIPAMKLPDNNGNDSTNENLHNYFVQVIAKGGVFQLLLIITNFLLIIKFWKKKKNNLIILQYLIPILTVSMFDPTMESVRFPLIFYSFLGYFFINEKAYNFNNN